jgi:hypothetical protein
MPTTTPVPRIDTWGEYQQALDKRDRLAADLRSASVEMPRLRREAPAARRADDEAAAAALADGTKAPARKAEQANKAAVEQAEAAYRALEIAVRGADERVRSLLAGQREQARQAAQETLEQAHAVYEQTISDLAAARLAFYSARRAVDWLNDPTPLPWKETRPAPPLRMQGVTTADGGPVSLERVLVALEKEVRGDTTPVTSPIFTPGADQRSSGQTANVKVTIPDAINAGEKHVVYIQPEDVRAQAEAMAARNAATLERDRQENIAAARATAKQFGLPDPLADLRE